MVESGYKTINTHRYYTFRECKTLISTLRVTYHHNSGFSIHIGDTLLIFDYWEGKDREIPQEAKITVERLKLYKNVYVFVSSSHIDHLDSIIYTWQNIGNVKYFTSDDVPLQPNSNILQVGDCIKINDYIDVTAYGSTDWGVSFLVRVDKFNVFHAGNLNLWHWRDESTPAQIEESQEAYENVLATLRGLNITVAFFPVDPRQGLYFDAGAIQFVLDIKPKLIIPMHFQNRGEIAQKFASEVRNQNTEALAMTVKGISANIENIKGEIFATILTAQTNEKHNVDEVIEGAGEPVDL